MFTSQCLLIEKWFFRRFSTLENPYAKTNSKTANSAARNKKDNVMSETENLLGTSLNSSSTTATVSKTPKIEKEITVDPRKMIADRPLLLQDLSNSKLLNKYKSEKNGRITGNSSSVDCVPNDPNSNCLLLESVENPTTLVTERVDATLDDDYGGVYGTQPLVTKELSFESSKMQASLETFNVKQVDVGIGKLDDHKSIENVEINFAMKALENPNAVIENGATDDANFDLAIDNGILSAYDNPSNVPTKSGTTTPRNVFNPLHVILKDKNRYYTTEFI
jgi:hypothetical protein